MSTSERGYHHGDLRRSLIDAGLAHVAEVPPDAVSLRELARRVGVSPTAVYRHFPDKAAFIAALAQEGLALLGQAQQAAFDRAGGGLAGFSATGSAYVRFALAHATLFRLIFQHPGATDLTGSGGDRPAAVTLLLDNARRFATPDIDAETFATQAWSLAHGMAVLMLDGHLPPDDALIDAVIDAHVAPSARRRASPGA